MAAPRMFQAVDTFVAEMADGSALHVAKGAVFHELHELVKRDKGSGLLFRPLEGAEDEKPAKSTAKRAPAAPAAAEGA